MRKSTRQCSQLREPFMDIHALVFIAGAEVAEDVSLPRLSER
jgi:hypothetical protein